jgi:hypothetical protein
MSKNIDQTRMLAESHALEFKDHGGGHVQISGHGVQVNYWPDSKSLTAHIVGGDTIKHCRPFDAVKLCMTKGKLKVKKKHVSKNGPDFSLKPIRTNSAGIVHFYSGSTPPWEFNTMIRCESDNIRLESMALLDKANAMDAEIF